MSSVFVCESVTDITEEKVTDGMSLCIVSPIKTNGETRTENGSIRDNDGVHLVYRDENGIHSFKVSSVVKPGALQLTFIGNVTNSTLTINDLMEKYPYGNFIGATYFVESRLENSVFGQFDTGDLISIKSRDPNTNAPVFVKVFSMTTINNEISNIKKNIDSLDSTRLFYDGEALESPSQILFNRKIGALMVAGRDYHEETYGDYKLTAHYGDILIRNEKVISVIQRAKVNLDQIAFEFDDDYLENGTLSSALNSLNSKFNEILECNIDKLKGDWNPIYKYDEEKDRFTYEKLPSKASIGDIYRVDLGSYPYRILYPMNDTDNVWLYTGDFIIYTIISGLAQWVKFSTNSILDLNFKLTKGGSKEIQKIDSIVGTGIVGINYDSATRTIVLGGNFELGDSGTIPIWDNNNKTFIKQRSETILITNDFVIKNLNRYKTTFRKDRDVHNTITLPDKDGTMALYDRSSEHHRYSYFDENNVLKSGDLVHATLNINGNNETFVAIETGKMFLSPTIFTKDFRFYKEDTFIKRPDGVEVPLGVGQRLVTNDKVGDIIAKLPMESGVLLTHNSFIDCGEY